MKYLIDTNILLEILPINYRARVHKKTAVDDPLLKVPPASRGNRTGARFPSQSRGNRTRARFPSQSRGNLRRGEIVNFAHAVGII